MSMNYYHRDHNYKRGGRRSNSGRYNNNERYNIVQQIKEATGNYYSNNEIIHHLKEVNDDMDKCIQLLIEKRQNSWSNVVAPTKLVITNPRTNDNNEDNNNSEKRYEKKESKRENKNEKKKRNEKR